jgi:hypothetical protein
MKFTFICEREMDLFGPKIVNTTVVEGEQTTYQLLERFEDFLRGNGYIFDGHLDFVDDSCEFSSPQFDIDEELKIYSNNDPETPHSLHSSDLIRPEDC